MTAPDELAFPDYDGNGMFKSLGNMMVNPECRAALHRPARETAAPARQRLGDALAGRPAHVMHGRRAAHRRVKARAIFPNCPRYIPKMQLIEHSKYVPQLRIRSGRAAWMEEFKEVRHPRQPTWKGEPSRR